MPADDVNIPLLTYEVALKAISERTGVDALASDQGAYFADHYNCKKYKPTTLFSADNVTMFSRDGGKEEKGFVKMVEASSVLQQKMVGASHELAFTGELAIHITTLCLSLIKEQGLSLAGIKSWMLDLKIVLGACELYENPLGGLSWSAYHMISELSNQMYTGKAALSLVALKQFVEDGGMNHTMTSDFTEIAAFACNARKCDPTDKATSFAKFVSKASEFSYLLGRDKFRPVHENVSSIIFDEDSNEDLIIDSGVKHFALAIEYLSWNKENTELRSAMSNECVGLNMLDSYCTRILPVLCPTGAKELQAATQLLVGVVPCVNLAILLG